MTTLFDFWPSGGLEVPDLIAPLPPGGSRDFVLGDVDR
jgi:hypothetical protein